MLWFFHLAIIYIHLLYSYIPFHCNLNYFIQRHFYLLMKIIVFSWSLKSMFSFFRLIYQITSHLIMCCKCGRKWIFQIFWICQKIRWNIIIRYFLCSDFHLFDVFDHHQSSTRFQHTNHVQERTNFGTFDFE